MIGTKVTSQENLTKINIEQAAAQIRGGNESLKNMIFYLRSIKEIDKKAYNVIKRDLPFLTTAVFNPPYRKTENVEYSECLFLDFDNFESETELQTLKEKLINDKRTALCFISPGGNGLKALFILNQKIKDPDVFKLVFEQFAQEFSAQLGVSKYIDLKAKDIARATFLSYDPQVYFNLNSEKIVVDIASAESVAQQMKEWIKGQTDNKASIPSDANKTDNVAQSQNDLPPEIIDQIKIILGQRPKSATQKREPYTPEQLITVLPIIIEKVKEAGLDAFLEKRIQYGLQIKITYNLSWASINVFYGKKGFNVYAPPKNGDSEQLRELGTELIKNIVSDIEDEKTEIQKT